MSSLQAPSAGSIVAALLGAGASVDHLKSAVSTIDFDKLFLTAPEDLGGTAIRLERCFSDPSSIHVGSLIKYSKAPALCALALDMVTESCPS